MRTQTALGIAAVLGSLAVTAVAAELSGDVPAAPAASRSMTQPVAPNIIRDPNGVVVVISSASLGDDCGRAPGPSRKKSKPGKGASMDMESQHSGAAAKMAARACDATSLQLSVMAGANAPATTLTVKSIEVVDEKGNKIADLAPTTTQSWDTKGGVYAPWDGKVAPGQDLQVRYSMNDPDWTKVKNRRDKSYTMNVVVTIGGKDQSLVRNVSLWQETTLPPGVVT